MKVGELMLQYPTNVYPENIAFDSTVLDSNNTISFKFNGDILTGALYHVFDYNTGELVLTKGHVYQLRTPIVYNGQELKMADGFLNDLDNGKDYAMQIMVLQWQSDGTAPLCDMFVLRGQTQENYLTTDDTTITIEDKISSIYEWEQTTSEGWRNNSVRAGVVVTSCELVIGEERRHIVAYQETTGKAVLSSALPSNIPAGTKYQIYCNYKVSPLYFFKCRQTPQITPTMELIDYAPTSRADSTLGFHVTATYNGYNSLINYYNIKLYWNWTGDDTVPWRLVDETDNIYSQKIESSFFEDFILHYKKRVNGEILEVPANQNKDLYYKAVVNIVTVDGLSCSGSSSIISCGGLEDDVPKTIIQALVVHNQDKPDAYYTQNKDSFVFARTPQLKHMIHIVGAIDRALSPTGDFPSGTKYTYYRENLNTGEIRVLETVDDATVPTKGKYRYYYVPREGTTGRAYLNGISYVDVEMTADASHRQVETKRVTKDKFNKINMNGYTITELILQDEIYQWGTKTRYKTGDQWKIVGEIEDTTITQNMDKHLHVSYNTYPTQTVTKTNYLTGTLTAMNGYVDCTTRTYIDDIDTVRAWREFISRPSIYMLKTQKGDVLIVTITDNPTTTYQENNSKIPTVFSFNWAEVLDVNDIKVDYIIDVDPSTPY